MGDFEKLTFYQLKFKWLYHFSSLKGPRPISYYRLSHCSNVVSTGLELQFRFRLKYEPKVYWGKVWEIMETEERSCKSKNGTAST